MIDEWGYKAREEAVIWYKLQEYFRTSEPTVVV